MTRYTRGEFLGVGAAFAGAMGTGVYGSRVPTSAQVRAAPDLAVVNATVYTSDDARPTAEAFAVKSGRFLAVGSTDDIRNLVTADTQVIDGSGLTVTAGFIDTHSHPSGVRELIGVNVDLRSIPEVQEALRRKAAETPPGFWVEGYKYDDTKFVEGRAVTRRDLDEAVPDHPAMVGHRGGHTGVYNSKAFEMAGVTAETQDPPGGHFYVEDGELTGKVAELARRVFNGVGQRPEVTRETRRDGVRFISQEMTAAGLTTVHNAGGGTNDLIAYQDAYEAGEMRFRMYMLIRGGLFDDLKTAGIRTGFGDDMLRIGAVKFSADGSASERTMRMSTPFIGRPDDYGILTMTPGEIHEAVEDAHRAGFQIGIHANGDVTIGYVLDAYERVLDLWPREDARHRIEHCSLVNPELLTRIRNIGAIPTPFYTYVHFHGNKWVEYGEEKMRWMFAHRSFLDSGIRVAGASDYMPGPFPPMMAIQSMVTRKDTSGRVWGSNQRISVEDALRICTINGAYASFEEDVKGSITEGKLADFVILSDDPHTVDPDSIKDIPVLRTVVGGRTVHQA